MSNGAEVDWADVFNEHGPRMLAIAGRVLGGEDAVVDGQTAEDVVIDVLASFITSAKKTAQYLAADNPTNYLLGSVRNRCIDVRRRGRRQRLVDHNDEATSAQLPSVPPDTDTTGDVVADADRMIAIAAALDRLEDRKRVIVEACVLHSRSNADVGRQLNITGQRVGQILTEAVEELAADPAFDGTAPIVQVLPPEEQPEGTTT